MSTRLDPSHAALLEALHAASFEAGARWSAKSFATLLALPGHGGLLAPDGAGFLLGRMAADEAELLTLAVPPAFRRRGIGAALLLGWREMAAAAGAATLYLEVGSGNAAAQALYISQGFTQVGRRSRYYADGSDALVFALKEGEGSALDSLGPEAPDPHR